MSYKKFYIRFLENTLKDKQQKNRSFSLRSFAHKLGLNPGSLSQVLSGKRLLTVEQANKIANVLQLDESNFKSFIKSVSLSQLSASSIKAETTKALPMLELGAEFMHVFTAEHSLIHCLLMIKSKNHNEKKLSKLSGLDEVTVKQILNDFVEIGIAKFEDNSYVCLNRYKYAFKFPDKNAIQQAHIKNLGLAKKSLLEDSFDKRIFTAINIPVHYEDLEKFRVLLAEFQAKILEFAYENANNKTDIDCDALYQTIFYFYPITKFNISK